MGVSLQRGVRYMVIECGDNWGAIKQLRRSLGFAVSDLAEVTEIITRVGMP